MDQDHGHVSVIYTWK